MKKILLYGIICTALSIKAQITSSNNFPKIEDLAIQPGMADPFIKPDGSRVNSIAEWPAQRVHLKAMLTHYIYGEMPPRPQKIDVKLLTSILVFDRKAVHERYALTLNENNKTFTFHFEVIRPLLNDRLPGIIKNGYNFFFDDHFRARKDKAAAEEAVSRGYLICKFNRREVAADSKNNRNTGVFPLYPGYDWGTVAAWAWAYGVVADALDQLELIDMEKIVITGHSRGGKAALCASIYDERFAITVPNNCGRGGGASLRYSEAIQIQGRKAEPISNLMGGGAFPHWFKDTFDGFKNKEEYLPFDAHIMKALIAPRPLLTTYGEGDYWSNPHGNELTYRVADMVFTWLGVKDKNGLHLRGGGHDQGASDWEALFDFADKEFFNIKSPQSFTTLSYSEACLPINWNVPENGDASIAINSCTSLSVKEQTNEIAEILMYPNPVSEILSIYLPGKENKSTTLSVYNIRGSLVKTITAKNGKNKVDVDNLSAGLYFMVFNHNNKVYNRKFVKE